MQKKVRSSAKADSIRQILMKEDEKLWSRACIDSASDRPEEMCFGWRPVRPRARYDLRKPNTKRRKPSATLNAASTLSVNQTDVENSVKRPYMSGELDDNYCYVYRGGLSSRAEVDPLGGALAAHASYLQPRNHVQTVTLESSAATEASAHALAHCRDELSRILALQLKPELLVEQLIIENRLRTMSLAAFPVLESSGGASQCKKSVKSYSQSTPSLGSLPNTHVDYQRHRRGRERHRMGGRREGRHLQWCDSLSSQRSSGGGGQVVRPEEFKPHWPLPELTHQQSALHHRNHASHTTCRHKPPTNSRTYTDNIARYLRAFTNSTAARESSSNYRLPVVSPTLSSESQKMTRKQPHTLLYTSDSSSSSHHRSNTLTTGSSLYYPSVSYSNSQLK